MTHRVSGTPYFDQRAKEVLGFPRPMKMVQNFLNRAEGFGDILEDLFKGSTIDLDKNLVVYDSSYITAGFESQQEFTLN